MPLLNQVQQAVATHLDRFIAGVRTQSTGYGSEALMFIDAAVETLQGGKRLRARFSHAGWRAVARVADTGAVESESVWDLCAALEIFQSAALVHDDLIDNSDTRRGRPAAHRDLQHRHSDRSWAGDAEAFGRSAAILLGDLLISWSDDLLEQALAQHPHAASVRAVYARMRTDVTIGQFLDIAEESAWRISPDDEHVERALRVVSLKSARYSIEQPLALGAALAGADAAQLSALRAFGHPIGMAFQLRDDILGVFGDASVTGKPAGDDLREGKRTVLIALARQQLDASARDRLDHLLGDPALDEEQVAELQATISASGAREHIERMIDGYVADADRALDGADLDHASVADMRELARAATARTA
jgi:geranylgeranyl diphosphate synthase type I